MNKLIPIALLAFAACTHKQNTSIAHKPAQASATDCDRLYMHILDLTVKTTWGGDGLPSKDELNAAIVLLDKEMQDRGTTARFLSYCNGKMTFIQYVCSMDAANMSEIDACKTLCVGACGQGD